MNGILAEFGKPQGLKPEIFLPSFGTAEEALEKDRKAGSSRAEARSE